ncbi:hypothetical protein ACTMTF_44345 [Nonomuraea sp. ZG12]|uniref:hypothetical protein n=1 Tax=Nonomuraea sp. ZG12 TaxID=3452207 RepID=UPI003F8AC9FC
MPLRHMQTPPASSSRSAVPAETGRGGKAPGVSHVKSAKGAFTSGRCTQGAVIQPPVVRTEDAGEVVGVVVHLPEPALGPMAGVLPPPRPQLRRVVVRMAASRMPHRQLLDIDARMEQAAAKPVTVPDTVVIDGGKVFISDTSAATRETAPSPVLGLRPQFLDQLGPR